MFNNRTRGVTRDDRSVVRDDANRDSREGQFVVRLKETLTRYRKKHITNKWEEVIYNIAGDLYDSGDVYGTIISLAASVSNPYGKEVLEQIATLQAAEIGLSRANVTHVLNEALGPVFGARVRTSSPLKNIVVVTLDKEGDHIVRVYDQLLYLSSFFKDTLPPTRVTGVLGLGMYISMGMVFGNADEQASVLTFLRGVGLNITTKNKSDAYMEWRRTSSMTPVPVVSGEKEPGEHLTTIIQIITLMARPAIWKEVMRKKSTEKICKKGPSGFRTQNSDLEAYYTRIVVEAYRTSLMPPDILDVLDLGARRGTRFFMSVALSLGGLIAGFETPFGIYINRALNLEETRLLEYEALANLTLRQYTILRYISEGCENARATIDAFLCRCKVCAVLFDLLQHHSGLSDSRKLYLMRFVAGKIRTREKFLMTVSGASDALLDTKPIDLKKMGAANLKGGIKSINTGVVDAAYSRYAVQKVPTTLAVLPILFLAGTSNDEFDRLVDAYNSTGRRFEADMPAPGNVALITTLMAKIVQARQIAL